jgi:hypothetical protein
MNGGSDFALYGVFDWHQSVLDVSTFNGRHHGLHIFHWHKARRFSFQHQRGLMTKTALWPEVCNFVLH